MDRETLAAQIYIRGDHNPESAFADADAFIEECKRQRKEETSSQPEPPKCEHRPEWITNMGYCAHCGEDLPEPAPKREAKPREWRLWIDKYGNLKSYLQIENQFKEHTLITVREVLND